MEEGEEIVRRPIEEECLEIQIGGVSIEGATDEKRKGERFYGREVSDHG